MAKKKYVGKLVLIILTFGILSVLNGASKSKAASKTALQNKVEGMTSEKIKSVYYSDYDGDGQKEAFFVTKKASSQYSIWYSSKKETRKLTDTYCSIYTGKGRGICKVSKKQQLFVAEGDAGGSGSWSYCYYVKKGVAYKVKHSGEGLYHTSGKDFVVFPSAFDAYFYDGIGAGHTWKKYYLKWTGTKFEQYKAVSISKKKLKEYSGGKKYIKQIEKAGYKIGTVYYRKNGIININVSKKSSDGGINYGNVTLKVSDKRVKLVVIYPKGKDIVSKSSYGGIYKAKCRM